MSKIPSLPILKTVCNPQASRGHGWPALSPDGAGLLAEEHKAQLKAVPPSVRPLLTSGKADGDSQLEETL